MERITARKNPLLQQVRRLLSSRKEREESGLFAADGTKLLREAIAWWPGLHTVILSDVSSDSGSGSTSSPWSMKFNIGRHLLRQAV